MEREVVRIDAILTMARKRDDTFIVVPRRGCGPEITFSPTAFAVLHQFILDTDRLATERAAQEAPK